MKHQPNVTSRTGSTTNLWLLVSLLLTLLVLPLLEGFSVGRALLLLGMTSTIIAGAVAARSRLRPISLVLLILALPTAWATLFISWKPLFVAHCLLGSAFFWLVGGVVVFLVINTRTVTFDSVFGAICAYLLFGLAWALTYSAIHTVTPDALSFPEERAPCGSADVVQFTGFSRFIYYSFVTMTTLGYGDVTPVGHISRALTWVQAVTGQFYVAVVIAWLVSALPRPGDEAR
jgi:voltage-gated potassium channel